MLRMDSDRETQAVDHHDSTWPISREIMRQDRLSVLGYMASSVAHELSNPLTTIAHSMELILAFWPHSDPSAELECFLADHARPPEDGPEAEVRKDLELVLAEAQRAGGILANLLAFARDQKPEWRPVSMVDVVQRAITLTRHHLNQRSVDICSSVLNPRFTRPEWCWVMGDAGHLQQALINLIINAEQAIRSIRDTGAIKVHLRYENETHVRIIVEDDGPGVPPELHRTIFEAFYTTKKKGEGTGLGLSIAAGIVSRHGGQLEVRDRDTSGAAFSMVLPRTVPASPLDETRSEQNVTRPHDQTDDRIGSVLLVDDEAGIRHSVGRFLRRVGCDVHTVATGQDAIDALADRSYDAVVSDLRMPGLSGEDLYHVIQKSHPDLATRVVFTSGDTMRPETQSFLRQSGCPSLQKPYELNDLMGILKQIWAKPYSSSPSV